MGVGVRARKTGMVSGWDGLFWGGRRDKRQSRAEMVSSGVVGRLLVSFISPQEAPCPYSLKAQHAEQMEGKEKI